jgi:hypothetical protein
MWVLLIIFLGPEIFMQQELYRYATRAECQVERNRIGFILAETYPEAGFLVECQFTRGRLDHA